jgi:hypothetical protein
MNLNELPKDMQEDILKLASQHPITIQEAIRYYLMGGEHADILCRLKSVNCPEEFIKLQNDAMWAKKNKLLMKQLKSQ